MTHREFEGRTAAEAAIKACEELGVTRSALRYQVISETGEDLADRHVVIAVDVAESAAREEERVEEPRETRAPREPRPRSRGRRRPERRDDRSRGRRRGGRGGRGGRRGERATAEEGNIERLLNLEPIPSEPIEERPEINGEPSERARAGGEVLGELMHLLDFEIEPCLVQDGQDEVHFDLRGEDVGRVIGNKGDVLLALQFLTNRILARRGEGEQHIVLDAANYRDRRRTALAGLAQQLADRAEDQRKVVRLSPMSAHDRRIFHITLQEREGVTTRSEGDGLYRPLLIIPTAD